MQDPQNVSYGSQHFQGLVVTGGEGGRGAQWEDLNVLCKHFKKLKYNNLGLNCHFVFLVV